jgi:hypothetical protein
MKFEEAIEKINDLFIEPCIPGYSSGDFAPEFLGQIEDLEEIIEELQTTYASKIKMTKKQKQAIEVNLLGLFDIDSDTDWDTGFIDEDSLGVVVISELSGLAEDDVVRAWLHPELIEVVE